MKVRTFFTCGLAAALLCVGIAFAEDNMGRVRIRTVEKKTGETVACRIHFTDKRFEVSARFADRIKEIFDVADTDRDGRAVWADFEANVPKFNRSFYDSLDKNGDGTVTAGELPVAAVDLRKVFEGIPTWHTFVACPGEVEAVLPSGEYQYEADRGPEYALTTGVFTVDENEDRDVTIQIQRIADLAAEGWWSGELHVHRDIEDMEQIMAAGDLHVAPVLTWWNERNHWAGRELPEKRVREFEGHRFCDVLGGEDERDGGAFLYYNCERPIDITAAERHYPPPVIYLERAERTQPQIWIDIEKPFWWDVPAVIAHGYGDSIGIANNHIQRDRTSAGEAWGRPRDPQFDSAFGTALYSQHIYYQLLDAGVRIPPSAGSASGVTGSPVGYNRVYVNVYGPLTYARWWEGLRAGRCFVTNGPLLRVTANGKMPGHVFKTMPGKSVSVELEAKLDTRDPVSAIEIIRNGEVYRRVPVDKASWTGGLGELVFDASGWFLVRAIADNDVTFRFASTGPFYVDIGGKRRVSRASAQYFIDWLEERRTRIDLDTPVKQRDMLAFYDRALEFWMSRRAAADAD